MPPNLLQFCLGATYNVLPSASNLVRWHQGSDPSCPLCHKAVGTVIHFLTCCQVAVNQGRITFRHDSVLNKLIFKSKDVQWLHFFCTVQRQKNWIFNSVLKLKLQSFLSFFENTGMQHHLKVFYCFTLQVDVFKDSVCASVNVFHFSFYCNNQIVIYIES